MEIISLYIVISLTAVASGCLIGVLLIQRRISNDLENRLAVQKHVNSLLSLDVVESERILKLIYDVMSLISHDLSPAEKRIRGEISQFLTRLDDLLQEHSTPS